MANNTVSVNCVRKPLHSTGIYANVPQCVCRDLTTKTIAYDALFQFEVSPVPGDAKSLRLYQKLTRVIEVFDTPTHSCDEVYSFNFDLMSIDEADGMSPIDFHAIGFPWSFPAICPKSYCKLVIHASSVVEVRRVSDDPSTQSARNDVSSNTHTQTIDGLSNGTGYSKAGSRPRSYKKDQSGPGATSEKDEFALSKLIDAAFPLDPRYPRLEYHYSYQLIHCGSMPTPIGSLPEVPVTPFDGMRRGGGSGGGSTPIPIKPGKIWRMQVALPPFGTFSPPTVRTDWQPLLVVASLDDPRAVAGASPEPRTGSDERAWPAKLNAQRPSGHTDLARFWSAARRREED